MKLEKENILDKTERKYLERLLYPFRNRIKTIRKMRVTIDSHYEYLNIQVNSIVRIYMCSNYIETINLPCFKKNSMYRGMKLNRDYTLNELGLFKATINNKKPKIGDYVQYVPDKKDYYYLSSDISGIGADQYIDNEYDPISWRIMEVDENGNIKKIFGVPAAGQKGVGFGKAMGYITGVSLLNEICESRYRNASLGATGRSLTIEDIESRINSKGIAARNAYKAGTVQYGTTKKYTGSNIKYPAIYAQEKYSGVYIDNEGNLVEVRDVADGIQVITENADMKAQAKMNPDGKTQSDDTLRYNLANMPLTFPADELICTQTYYGVSQLSSYYDDSNFYNMIFGTGTYFWLASRYVYCDSDDSYAYFGLRYVCISNLLGNYLFNSIGNSNNYSNRLASVVSLGSGIQVKSGSGTESDPYVLGK